LAPEEILPKDKHELKTSGEKAKAERNRQRRLKKQLMRRKQKAREEALQKKSKINISAAKKYESLQALKKIREGKTKSAKLGKKGETLHYGSSAAFFSKLGEQAYVDVSFLFVI
jgi:hypothetical protein